MSFKDFLINYFSPWFLLGRLMWLGLAFFFHFLVLMGLVAFMGWSTRAAHFAGLAVSMLCVWNALRPWQVGPSIRDVSRAVDQAINRFER